MIGGGIFNQPIMGHQVYNPIKIIAKFCLKGLLETKNFVNGIFQETFPVEGLAQNKIKITARIKQRCDDDC